MLSTTIDMTGVPLLCEQCDDQSVATRVHTAHRAVAHSSWLILGETVANGTAEARRTHA